MPKNPIPKHAKRVHKGVIFDVYQWKQKMYDGSTRTFEVAKRQNSVLVIPAVGNKIAITKQQQPRSDWYYGLPAGRMDKPGESPKQAALRELREETGLKPARIKLWKTIPKHIGKIIFNIHIFIAQDCKKVAKPSLDGGEKITTRLLSFEEFLEISDSRQFDEPEVIIDLLRARLHPKLKRQLKKEIFG